MNHETETGSVRTITKQEAAIQCLIQAVEMLMKDSLRTQNNVAAGKYVARARAYLEGEG